MVDEGAASLGVLGADQAAARQRLPGAPALESAGQGVVTVADPAGLFETSLAGQGGDSLGQGPEEQRRV